MALIFISLTCTELEHLCTSVCLLDFLSYPLVTSLTHLLLDYLSFLSPPRDQVQHERHTASVRYAWNTVFTQRFVSWLFLVSFMHKILLVLLSCQVKYVFLYRIFGFLPHLKKNLPHSQTALCPYLCIELFLCRVWPTHSLAFCMYTVFPLSAPPTLFQRSGSFSLFSGLITSMVLSLEALFDLL